MPDTDNTPQSDPEVSALMYAPVLIGGGRVAVLGTPDDEELKLINKFAPSPLVRDGVFIVPGIASTDAVDSYFTHMDEKTSLRNFVKDLRGGAALLDSHNAYRLPIGASYFGELQDIPDGVVEGVAATKGVAARFYMLRDHNVPGSGNTEDYIKGIQGGTIRRLSIGFGGPNMRIVCDEDGLDIWDWDSPHWPGEVLPDGRTVTYTVFDANLYETSMVYKNATPGALIARYQHLILDRRIAPGAANLLEQRTGVRFQRPPSQITYSARAGKGSDVARLTLAEVLAAVPQTRAGAAISSANRKKLDDMATRAEVAGADVQAIAGELAQFIADNSATDGGTNATITPEQRSVIAVLPADLTPDTARALVRDAEAGRQYRKSVIDEVIRARSAAQEGGMTADAQARFRRLLDGQDFEDLEGLYELWSGKRAAVLVPGRLTPQPLREAPDGDQGNGGEPRSIGGLREVG